MMERYSMHPLTLRLPLLLLLLLPGLANVDASEQPTPIPKFDLPPPPGPYDVKYGAFELVDETRLDPFNASHFRRLMASRFDPVENCSDICQVSYMPPATAKLEDDIIVPAGWVGGLLDAARLSVCCDEDNDDNDAQGKADTKFPLLVFSPGWNTSRLWYNGFAQGIASTGYTVITLDHTYETSTVEFPDGTIISGGRVNLVDPEDLDKEATWALSVRAADISFALDSLGYQSREHRTVGVLGHSFGGASAVTVVAQDLRVAGGINLDGSLFGRVVQNGFGSGLVQQAFVLFGSTGHTTGGGDPTWSDFWKHMHEPPHDQVWTKELNVGPSVHNSYEDYSILVDTAGVRDQLSENVNETMAGPMEGARMRDIVAAYTRDFYAFVLEGADEGLFEGPSDDYPEVEFIPYGG